MDSSEIEVSKLALVEIAELLPLMRAYCDFYEVQPRDDRLVGLSRALLNDPSEGIQTLARVDGRTVGFSTVYWSWSTLDAARIGLLDDLYVDPRWRGRGVGGRLIEAARASCRKRGVPKLSWDTAPDNHAARRLYEATGASSSTWVSYEVEAW